uniref:KH domain-containing protein n=1 Tax=Angiostrongylus cantonensis TaxID=6313 RepID=A0A0K0DNQ0_ANGCA
LHSNFPWSLSDLVIGRGGSEIQNIQSTTGCRVQMSPDGDPGTGVRQCTLQGSKIAVERAKQMITEVITRAASRPSAQNFTSLDGRAITIEMTIPATKCGLVIGKMGETIKQLQVIHKKIVYVNQLPVNRIDLNVLKLSTYFFHYGFSLSCHFTNMVFNVVNLQVVVPRASVGMIIGKGGETIKRLALETGTKIQFKADDDPSSPDRCAVIMGSREQIYKATELITELVHKSCSGAALAGQTEAFYMHVPSNKTGLVIGKGGETIKQINAESGAHCELSRDPPPNPQEKVFIIRGTPFQIHHAQHIIRIKVCFFWFIKAHAELFLKFVAILAQQTDAGNGWANHAGQYYAGAAAAASAQNSYGSMQSYTYVPQSGGQPASASQSSSTTSSGPTINPQTGQPDYSAQWAEYYRFVFFLLC